MRLILVLTVTTIAVIGIYLYLGQAITPTEEDRIRLQGPATEMPDIDLSDLRTSDPIEKPDRPEIEEPLELPPLADFDEDSVEGPFFDLAVPLTTNPPVYPEGARLEGIEGWVLIEFDILPNGKVENPVVIDSSPEGTFDEAALAAIRGNTYKAKIVDGKAVRQEAVQDTIEFYLEETDDTDE